MSAELQARSLEELRNINVSGNTITKFSGTTQRNVSGTTNTKFSGTAKHKCYWKYK